MKIEEFDLSVLSDDDKAYSIGLIGRTKTGKTTFIKTLRDFLNDPIVIDSGAVRCDGKRENRDKSLIITFNHHSYLINTKTFDFIGFFKEDNPISLYNIYKRWFTDLKIPMGEVILTLNTYTANYGVLLLDVKNKKFWYIKNDVEVKEEDTTLPLI